MRRPPIVLLLAILGAILPAASRSSSDPGYWFQIPAPYLDGHDLLYPMQGGWLVSFGHSDGDEVYLRSTAADSTWRLLPATNAGPGVTHGRAAVYDPVSNRLLVVGGGPPGTDAQIWSFDLASATWTQLAMSGLAPPCALSDRRLHAVLDPDSSRLLVIDALTSGSPLWIATFGASPGWTQRTLTGATSPGDRNHYGEAWDARGRRWIFHGGQRLLPFPIGDTWALHPDGGASWDSLPIPEQDAFHHSVFVDTTRNELILADGGTVGGTHPPATWAVFTHSLGSSGPWTSIDGQADDNPTWGATTYDAAHQQLYRHSGIFATVGLRRLTVGGPTYWERVDSNPSLISVGPPYQAVPWVVDTRRHQIIEVSCGSTNTELWSYAASRYPAWIQLSVNGAMPPRRLGGVAVYDSLRDRVLIHGGSLDDHNGRKVIFRDTWAYSFATSSWTQLGANGPTVDDIPIASPCMIDGVLDRMLIGHAHDAAVANPGLYAWDLVGAPNWHRIAVTGLSPDSLLGGASAFDPTTQRWIFHLGGPRVGSIQFTGATFTWNEWTGIQGAPVGVGLTDGGVLDPVRRRFIVFGDGPDCGRSVAWALPVDATPIWAPVGAAGLPPLARHYPKLVYEPATDVITLIGGYSYCWVLNEVYELRLGQQIPAFWTPPPAITDLTVMAVTESTVSLGWTAIRENAMAGRPQFYAIHSSPTPMSASDFDAAPFQIVKPANVTAGGFETTMQGELPPDSTFYFAVRLYDSHGSASPISNQPVARTLVGVEPPPPAGPSGIHLEFAANPSRPPIGVTWRADPSAAGASTRLRVHDLLGGLRRTFDLAGDQGTFQWDGRDDHGRRLPAGLYFARLTSGSKDAKARLVLIP